nr:MAG TPA: hypothetical protein [Caudoviricetes sp.]
MRGTRSQKQRMQPQHTIRRGSGKTITYTETGGIENVLEFTCEEAGLMPRPL